MKIVVPLKYLSNFWRSLETPLINCKTHLELNWTKNCVMYCSDAYAVAYNNNDNNNNNNNNNTTFKITNTKLYVPIVTLST